VYYCTKHHVLFSTPDLRELETQLYRGAAAVLLKTALPATFPLRLHGPGWTQWHSVPARFQFGTWFVAVPLRIASKGAEALMLRSDFLSPVELQYLPKGLFRPKSAAFPFDVHGGLDYQGLCRAFLWQSAGLWCTAPAHMFGPDFGPLGSGTVGILVQLQLLWNGTADVATNALTRHLLRAASKLRAQVPMNMVGLRAEPVVMTEDEVAEYCQTARTHMKLLTPLDKLASMDLDEAMARAPRATQQFAQDLKSHLDKAVFKQAEAQVMTAVYCYSIGALPLAMAALSASGDFENDDGPVAPSSVGGVQYVPDAVFDEVDLVVAP